MKDLNLPVLMVYIPQDRQISQRIKDLQIAASLQESHNQPLKGHIVRAKILNDPPD